MARQPPYAEVSTKPTGPTGPIERITPTAEEAANGWTSQALSEYVHQRREAEKARLDPHHPSRRQRPTRQKGLGGISRSGGPGGSRSRVGSAETKGSKMPNFQAEERNPIAEPVKLKGPPSCDVDYYVLRW